MNIESTATRRSDVKDVSLHQNWFVTKILPWVIAATGLVVYLGTLNHWVSINSITYAARASGLLWQPELGSPLYWLATLPIRLLPTGMIPIAMNVFSAVCAALTLCLLARSIALLPHDRTEEQRIREKHPDALLSIRTAWVPPVFAAVLCGLQLTFWEHATAASAEMLDLLIFAYLIRCLLEFRLDGRQTWLSRSSFIYAAAMANSWVMVAFFPVFLAAMIWLKGLSFFNLRFLMRMFVLGLAGLFFYLVLPIHVALTAENVSFWEALRHTLGQQWGMVKLVFNKQYLLNPDRPLWILALPSLLPLLIFGIRWPSYFGDPSKLGVAISTFTFHLFHGALLLYCVYIVLDPPMGHRNHNFFPSATSLSLYYLGALSLGYLVGYFLLVFGNKPVGRPRPVSAMTVLMRRTVLAGLAVVLLSTPLLLVYKNFGPIRLTNGPALDFYAKRVADSLKPGSVALSDDQYKLWLVELAAKRSGPPDCMFVFTGGTPHQDLQRPQYHSFLKRRYQDRWPTVPHSQTKAAYEHLDLVKLMLGLAETNSVYYLHPSFGYYFEVLYPEPHGLVNLLRSYPTNAMLQPQLPESIVQENQAIWAEMHKELLQSVAAWASPGGKPGRSERLEELLKALHIRNGVNPTASMLGVWNSRALTFWGVELQKINKLKEAAAAFSRAIELSPENLVARLNLECNAKLQRGEEPAVQLSKSVEEQFGRFGSWENIMTFNGPFDEPTICFAQAQTFVANRNVRQGTQLFARVKQLSPNDLTTRVRLAQTYTLSEMPDEALREINEIHTNPTVFQLNRTNTQEILFVETAARLSKKDIAGTQKAIETALRKHPDDTVLLAIASRGLIAFEYYSNALHYIEQRLRISPEDADALNDQGYTYMKIDMLGPAITALSRSLKLQTNIQSAAYYTTLFNRALAYLKHNKYDEAQKDYALLYKEFPDNPAINHGLGEIAFGKSDYRSAVNHYTVYLAKAPANTQEATNVIARLEEAKRKAM